MPLLTGKICLVTGSSRGIGREIALNLAAEGASVILNASKSFDEAEKVKESLLCTEGQKHYLYKADVGDPEEVNLMMKKIHNQIGKLDILVNNAGITKFIKHSDLHELSSDIFDKIYVVNLRGAFLCIQKALPLLRNASDALVVNISSIASISAVGSNIAYCAMKAAMVNMTMSLARALAPEIRVNAISPGLTETELTKDWENYRNEQIKNTPLGRLGTCTDIAKAVIALTTYLTYVTGQNIVIDGGRLLN